MYPASRPLLPLHICACKFRQTVKPAITTILPVCRCRHRDETARDSGPGRSDDKPGCHNLDHGARTTTTRLQSNGPTAGLKTDTELPPMGSVVINVQGASFDLSTSDADVLDRHTWQPNTATSSRAPQARRQTRSSYAPRFNDSRFNFPGSKRRE